MGLTRRRPLMSVTSFALSLAVVAAFVLSGWAFYASHRQSCKGRNTTLDVLSDILVIATTPRPGQKLTAEQKRDLTEFKKATFGRIAKARCT